MSDGTRRIAALLSMAFITGFSGAVMPGPMLALVIGQTTAQGLVAVPLIVGGHALLEIVTVLLLIAGLQAVLERSRVRGTIGLIGGAALVYMGQDMVRSAAGVALSLDHSAGAVPWLKLVFVGAAVCAANPYFIGWWATIGAGQLAHTAPRNASEYLAFYVGHELSDAVWYAIVGIIIITGRDWLSPAVYRDLILVCGAVVGALGLWFIYTGVRFISLPGATDD
jgi:threonine/homoserine/homoserine lactone efflux protein